MARIAQTLVVSNPGQPVVCTLQPSVRASVAVEPACAIATGTIACEITPAFT